MKKAILFFLVIIFVLIQYICLHNFVMVIINKDNQDSINLNMKRPVGDGDILESLANYPELKRILLNAKIDVPLINDFIPQGIVVIDDYIFITGYFESKDNSKCYVLNKKGEIVNEVELDNNSHVGSIAYDKINNLIWIPNNEGILSAYNKDDFLNKKHVDAKYSYSGFSIDLMDFQDIRKNHIAYLYVDNEYIYFGNFFINSNCLIKKYKIVLKNNVVNLKYINSFYVPPKTQSITFVEKDNEKYMLLSRSYGRHNSSQLYIYNYEDDIIDYNNLEIKMVDLPPMLEQISVDNNNLYLLFESGATKYWDCEEKLKVIPIINLEELLTIN